MKYPSSRILTLIALSVAATSVVAQNEEEITEAFSVAADIVTTGAPTSSPIVNALTLTDAPVTAASKKDNKGGEGKKKSSPEEEITGLLPSFFPTKEMDNKDGQVIFSFSPKKDEKTGEEVEEDKKKNKKDNDEVDTKKEKEDVVDKKKKEKDSDVADKNDKKDKKDKNDVEDKKEKDDIEEKDKKEKDAVDDLNILSPVDTQPKPINEAQIVIAIDDEVTLTPPLGPEIFIPVLENDSGSGLSVTQLISQATFGFCGISLDLTEVVYQPTSDFVDGVDSCDYEVCENGGINCATATVTIIVTAGGDPTMPPAMNDDVPTYPPTGGILTTPAPLPTLAFPTLSSPGDAVKTIAPTTSIGDVPTYPPTFTSTTVGSEPTGGTFKTSAPTSVVVITTPFPTESLSSVYEPNVPTDNGYDKDDVVPELRGTNKTIAPTPDADRPTPNGYYVPPPTPKDDDGYYVVPPPAPKDGDGYYDVPPPAPKDDDDEYEHPHSVDDGEEYHKPNKEPSSHRRKKPHHEEYEKKPWWAHDDHEHKYYNDKAGKEYKGSKSGKGGGYTKGGKTKSSKGGGGGDYYSKGEKNGGSGKAGKVWSGSSSSGGSWWWADRY